MRSCSSGIFRRGPAGEPTPEPAGHASRLGSIAEANKHRRVTFSGVAAPRDHRFACRMTTRPAAYEAKDGRDQKHLSVDLPSSGAGETNRRRYRRLSAGARNWQGVWKPKLLCLVTEFRGRRFNWRSACRTRSPLGPSSRMSSTTTNRRRSTAAEGCP